MFDLLRLSVLVYDQLTCHDCHKTFRADWLQTDCPIKPTLCTDPRLFQYNTYQVNTINGTLQQIPKKKKTTFVV